MMYLLLGITLLHSNFVIIKCLIQQSLSLYFCFVCNVFFALWQGRIALVDCQRLNHQSINHTN